MTTSRKIKYTHHFDNPVCATLTDDGWTLCGVTYQNLSCGCEVTGGGVLPGPLTVKLCPLHNAAPALLRQLEQVKGVLEYVEQAMRQRDSILPDPKAIQRMCQTEIQQTCAAIAAAKGA